MKVTLISNNVWDGETDINSLDQLAQLSVQREWSHAVFKDKTRKSANFDYSNFFVVDIDNFLFLNEAEHMASKYKCFIVLSRNHDQEKNGLVCDRYRIVFELEWPITSEAQFKETFIQFKKMFPAIDNAASSNPAGLWYKGKEVYKIFNGTKIRPAEVTVTKRVQPLEIISPALRPNTPSKATMRFVTQVEELGGQRWEPFRKACIDLKQQGYSLQQAINLLTSTSSEWFTNEYELKLQSIYNNVDPKHPTRLDIEIKSATEEFVTEYLIDTDTAVSYSRVFTKGKEVVSRGDVLRELRVKRLQQGLVKTHRDKDLEDVIDTWTEKARKNHIAAVRAALNEVHPDGKAELQKFLKAITGREDPIELAVMLHWIWQVKRKVFGYEVLEHLMPIFVGKQGSGKTYSITKILLKPLQDLATKTNFKALTDPREGRLVMDYFAIFLDELSGGDKAEVNEIKRILTSDVIKMRVMRETHHETGVVRATFIGASNKSVKDMIQDDTGMRRFYEISALDAVDQTAMNSLDPALIWKAIGPSDTTPYYGVQAAIRKAQEALRTPNVVEQWLLDAGQYAIEDKAETPAKDLFEAFKDWYGSSFTMTSFGKHLKQITGVVGRRLEKGMVYNLKQNSKPESEF